MSRMIDSARIERAVNELCLKANTALRTDVLKALREAYQREKKKTPSKDMLKVLVDNARIAKTEKLPICQDTGMVTVFVEIGKDVVVKGKSITDAVNRGVARAYKEGFFRMSVVGDPILRKNTKTNTPAVLHIDVVNGRRLKISVLPKGFGAENKGRIKMFEPTAPLSEIIDFIVETVKKAGPDACPPYVLGVGIGGTMESSALLSKKALLRPVGRGNRKQHIAKLEKEIVKKANALGIGVMGLGGKATVLGVSIEEGPTHIAGLPVAVSVSCHALRSASGVI